MGTVLLSSLMFQSHGPVSRSRLMVQSQCPIWSSSITIKSHTPVSWSTLKVQSNGPVSLSSLMVQSHGPVSQSSLTVQSHNPISWSKLTVQFHGPISGSNFSTFKSQKLNLMIFTFIFQIREGLSAYNDASIPLAELLLSAGFFIIYLLEELLTFAMPDYSRHLSHFQIFRFGFCEK